MDIITVKNKYPQQNTRIQLTVQSDTPLCKITGEPKEYTLIIDYIAENTFVGMREVHKIIESLLDEPTDLETLTQTISNVLADALQTSVKTYGSFIVSGGITLDVTAIAYIL